MKYLFDTDILIDLIRGKTDLEQRYDKASLSISIVSFGELLYGIYKSRDQEKTRKEMDNLFEQIEFKKITLSAKIMDQFGEIKANLELSGQKLDDFDILIAATAIVHGLTLVTRNTRHFIRVKTLKIAK